MAKITDPDNLVYNEYPYLGNSVNPTILNGGNGVNMLIDYEKKRFALTAPRYGTVGTGNSEMVGYGATGGVSGQALYSKFKNIWKEDPVAIRFPFPMEAITPESFEFINGWLPDDDTTDQSVSTTFITRKLIRDAGWAERAPNGNIAQRWFGSITLGAIELGPTGFTTVYYNAVNPGIQTSLTVGTDGSVDVTNNRVVFNGVVGNQNTVNAAPYFYTGDSVVYQTPGAGDNGVVGLDTNRIYYIRYADTFGAIPVGAGHSFTLHNSRADALSGASEVALTGSNAGVSVTFTAAGVPEEFTFAVTEEGGSANEPIQFFDTVQDTVGIDNVSVSAGNTALYNRDNFYEIFAREEQKTYGKQNNTDIGVAQISNQAYRFPLTSATDINVDVVDGDGSTTGIATAAYAGIGISFYQTAQVRSVANENRNFNIIINANGQTLKNVYSKVQYLLRQPIRVNSGIAGTDINSLSAVGYGNGNGAQNEYGNSFRYGAIQQPLLEFVGDVLQARRVDDIFNLTGGGTGPDDLGNLGVYIENVASADRNNVKYFDNLGQPREELFTATVDLTFNSNLFNDTDARFWVFYDDPTVDGQIIPGLSTSIPLSAGTAGVTPGIVGDNFDVGAGPNHPFVSGQKVVAIGTAINSAVGIAMTTVFNPTTLGVQGQGITTGVYYVNVRNTDGTAQTYDEIAESGTNTAGGDNNQVTGAGSSASFRLHNNYSDAIAADYLGINTISITADAAVGVVTFRQLDVNFAENSATIVKTGDAGGAAGEVNANTFLDGIDIPDNGEITFSYDYDSNSQRNRNPGADPAVRVVAVGLGTGQYAFAQASITRNKNQAVSVTGALERVYSDPA